LKSTNKRWRVDETFVRVKGKWAYLYRAVDSTGATIDFLLSAQRDAAAAKRFFQKALRSPGHPTPRVINVDQCPCYPPAVKQLKKEGQLRRRCRLRPVQYLNNILEQDHPGHKTTNKNQPRLPFILGCLANDRWLRGSEHDQEGTGKMGRQG
jgi:IS6 family transposase